MTLPTISGNQQCVQASRVGRSPLPLPAGQAPRSSTVAAKTLARSISPPGPFFCPRNRFCPRLAGHLRATQALWEPEDACGHAACLPEPSVPVAGLESYEPQRSDFRAPRNRPMVPLRQHCLLLYAPKSDSTPRYLAVFTWIQKQANPVPLA